MQERDDDLAALTSALEIEPSPRFAATVRQAVERERIASRWRSSMGVVAVACAAAFVLVIVQRRAGEPRVGVAPTVAELAPRQAGATVEAAAPASPPQTPSSSSAQTTRRAQAGRQQDVLIAASDARAFARFLAAIDAGLVPPPRGDDEVREALQARRLELGPLVVPELSIVAPVVESWLPLEN